MLASSSFLLVLGRPCPSSMRPSSICVHAKAKKRNQQTSNGRKQMQRACGKGIKLISMIGMASKEARKQANKQKDKQVRK